MIDTIGNILSIAGVLVTFVAYSRRRLRFRDLEPRLAALVQRARIRARRLFGRAGKHHTITVESIAGTSFMGTASVRVHAPIEKTDTIEVRVEKLARNHDNFVHEFDDFRQVAESRIADVQDKAMHRITLIEADIVARDEVERAAEVWSARWEIRGLMMVLVGTVMSSLW